VTSKGDLIVTTKRSTTAAGSIRRILVPVDFSAASLQAAAYAFALARQLGAEVRCTTVVDVSDLRVAMQAGLHDFDTSSALQRQVRKWIGGEFDRLTADAGVEVQRDVRRGIPELEILEAIGRYKPDLIVMGSTGIARRLPLGSRTRAVMRGTLVPVLTVRPRENVETRRRAPVVREKDETPRNRPASRRSRA
jgi:nucleotide-binding universal stress UspA family protein